MTNLDRGKEEDVLIDTLKINFRSRQHLIGELQHHLIQLLLTKEGVIQGFLQVFLPN